MPLQLHPLGSTAIAPETYFLWEPASKTTVELTEIGDEHVLVRASKSYRLCKRRKDRDSWTRNLHALNEYLRDTFSTFHLSVDYARPVLPEVTGLPSEGTATAQKAPQLLERRHRLETKFDILTTARDHGVEALEEHLQETLVTTQEELDRLDRDLEWIVTELDRTKRELGEWTRNGAMLAYLFTYGTDPTICHQEALESVIERHVQDVQDEPGYRIKQILEGERFQLYVDEVDQPHVLNRLEHTLVLNPASLARLQDAHPDLEETLTELQQTAAAQYQAYAVTDLAVDGATIEEAKATPARAVDTIIGQLDAENVVDVEDVPNDGPLIGYVDGTHQPFGFDPADGYEHFYINGATRSGKSVLFRVLFENCVSLGYDVLSITPSDREGIGAAFANRDGTQFTRFPEIPLSATDARAITANQYWPGHDRLLDLPDDTRDLFHGVNVVTLNQLSEADQQAFISTVFTELDGLDDLVKPLFVFLDEAHRISDADAVHAVTRSIREVAKHDVHVVLSTQLPMDLSHHMKEARLNLTTQIFLQGTDLEYIDRYRFFDEAAFTPGIVNELEQGQAIFSGIRGQNLIVNVRPPLSHVNEPSPEMIETLDARVTPHSPVVDSPTATPSRTGPDAIDLSEEQLQQLAFIASYTREHDREPSKRDCWNDPDAPFGAERSERVVSELEALGCITSRSGVRGGNETTLYAIADSTIIEPITE